MLKLLEFQRARNLTIDELGPDDCRFIFGEVTDARYCGLPVFKRSLCKQCYAICYEPPRDRKAAS